MKRIVLIAVLIIILGAGIYAYKLYTGKVKSLTEMATDANITATDLIAAFEKDTAAANKQYLGKILAVNGNVKEIEKESGTVVLGSGNGMSSVRCTLDSGYVKNIGTLNAGQLITIKGACTGFNADELGIGSDVVLNRCVIQSGKE